jgi:tyrosine aminotransferase
MPRTWEHSAPSELSERFLNPIRSLVQQISVDPNPDKEPIRLSVGDPTVYGNLE